jgi:hypothetical protein
MGNWQTFSTDGFTVTLPRIPERGIIIEDTPANPGFYQKTYYMQAGNVEFLILSMTIGPVGGATPTPEQVFAAFEKKNQEDKVFSPKGLDESRLTGQLDVTQDGFPGREYQFMHAKNVAASGAVRIVLVGRKLFMYGGCGHDAAGLRDFHRMMSSVKITD